MVMQQVKEVRAEQDKRGSMQMRMIIPSKADPEQLAKELSALYEVFDHFVTCYVPKSNREK